MKNSHRCKALVISCIDFRFVTRVRDFLTKHGLVNEYDLITVPGASLGFSDITASVATSIKLHNPNEIYIFDHEDCGAYGQNNTSQAHTENLKKAKVALANTYPTKKITTYLTGFENIKEIN
ncbi:MAG: hypothetical protein A2Z24_00895 [Candidatus Woykebacteria bacterium RBG_16_44_10]|uniref:Carbonic anhydrase n=1 Tax=Candidatus Woykebacteria bacterium RBG_16_44_10 TaxID=1802597 RepID=A0A1G1WEP9_9BACT|nr:MAG: hypothetical protein A2Z24_00895 [Candidatus Woykebacteria bacterium RBG_16_44_10]